MLKPEEKDSIIMKREEKIKAMKPGEIFRELKVRIKNIQDLQKVAKDTQAVSLTLAISYQVKSAKELAVEAKNRGLTPKGWMKDELQKCNIVDRTFWLSDEVADKLTARRAAMAKSIVGKATQEETQVDPEEIQEPLVFLNEDKVEKDIELKMSEIANIPSTVKEKIDIKTINAIPSLIKVHVPKPKKEITLDKAMVAFDKYGTPVKAFDKGTKWLDVKAWINTQSKKPTDVIASVLKYNVEGVAQGKKYSDSKKAKTIAYGFQWRYYSDVKAR